MGFRRSKTGLILALLLYGVPQAFPQRHQRGKAPESAKHQPEKVNYREAKRQYDAELKSLPDTPGSKADRIKLSIKLASVRVTLGEYAGAVEDLTPLKADNASEQAQILSILGHANSGLANYARAKGYYEAALRLRTENDGAQSPDVASSLYDLAEVFRAQGKYREAEPNYRSALGIREKTFGRDHAEYAEILTALGDLAVVQEKYAEAKAYFEDALPIQEKQLGKDHPQLARTQQGLGQVYMAQGRYKDAESYFRNAKQIRDNRLGDGHPDSLSTADSLGMLYFAQGDVAKARDYIRRANGDREENLKPNHPDLAFSMEHLGLLAAAEGDFKAAEEKFSSAAQMRLNTLGSDHPDYAASLYDLGMTYWRQQKYSEAEQRLRDALKIREQALGQEAPSVTQTLLELGALYTEQLRHDQAEPIYQRALAIQQKLTDPENPDLLRTVLALAMTYRAERQDVKAEPLFQRCLQAWRTTAAPQNLRLQALSGLGAIRLSQQQFSQAEQFLREALSIVEKASGPAAAQMTGIRRDLASACYGQHKYGDAIRFYRNSLPDMEKESGADPLDVAHHYYQLGESYSAFKNYADAATAQTKALSLFETKLPPGSTDVNRTIYALGFAYLNAGEASKAEPWLRQWITDVEGGRVPQDGELFRAVDAVANVNISRKKYNDAEKYLRKLLDIENRSGIPVLKINGTLTRLAEACDGQGKSDDAAHFYEQAAQMAAAASQYSEAQSLLLRAQAIRSTAGRTNTSEFVKTLTALGDTYLASKDFPKAKELYELGQSQSEKIAGSRDPAGAAPLIGLGRLFQLQGDFALAQEKYAQARVVLEGASSPDHTLQASVFFDQGSLAATQGKTKDAIDDYDHWALLLAQLRPADHPALAEQIETVATFYAEHDRKAVAEKLYRLAVEFQTQIFGAESGHTAVALRKLGLFVSSDQKRYVDAKPMLDRALKIFESTYGPESDQAGSILISLVNINQKIGDTAAAAVLLERYGKMLEKSAEKTTLFQFFDQLAALYRAQHDFVRVQQTYKRQVALYGRDDPNYMTAMQNLAEAYADGREFAQASKSFEDLIQAVRRTKGRGSSDEIGYLKYQAEALRRNEHAREADKLLRSAQEMEKRSFRDSRH